MDEDKKQDDEISLIDLFAVLWHRKKMIIGIVVTAMVAVVAFSIISLLIPPERGFLPNEFTPKALMLINNDPSAGGGISSLLNSSGLGSLAGLVGLSASGSTYSQLATYLIGTNSLLDSVVDEFGLIERYKIKKYPRAKSRKVLMKNLIAEFDSKSGVFSISFTDYDPAFAQRVVNYCVDYMERRFDELGVDKNKREKDNLEINIENTYREIQNLEQESHRLEQTVLRGSSAGNIPSITLELNRIALELGAQKQVYTQLKIQLELVKVKLSTEAPVFQILERAEIPDQKSGPSRGMLCIIVSFAAFFFAVFLAFILNAVSNIRKDPEAMAKLRGGDNEK